jgi:hypothetical protein
VIVEIRGGRFDLGPAELDDLRRQLGMSGREIDAEVAADEERADQEADAFEDPDEVLTLDEILDGRVVPLSRSTLYRVAKEGADDSPFYKRGGRWMATRGDLREWIRSAPRGSEDPVDPMPSTRNSAAAVLAEIESRGER